MEVVDQQLFKTLHRLDFLRDESLHILDVEQLHKELLVLVPALDVHADEVKQLNLLLKFNKFAV